MKSLLILSATLITLAACSSGTMSSPSEAQCNTDDECKGDRVCEKGTCVASDAAETTRTSPSDPAVTEPGAPTFLSFGTNLSKLVGPKSSNDLSEVTFTAVLTDPNGVDDVIGGTLKDVGGAAYGAFATSGQEGAYAMTISWAQLNAVAPITLSAGATGERVFVAEFFDVAGHKASKSVTLSLNCGELAACSGACVDTQSSTPNCGACGNACSGLMCSAGLCFGPENNDKMCSDGKDNDGNGKIDCDDDDCSHNKNPSVTVCP